MENVIHKRNGVNVDQLMQTIDLVKEDPEIAKFQFRAETEWLGGGHCKTKIKDFYGAKTEDSSRSRAFEIEGDEPPVLLGENNGANAVEALLHALASCLTVGFIYNAAAKGINVESLNFQMKGDLDLHAFLGLSESKRPGYEKIIVKYKVKSDAPKEQLKELCDYVQKTSPVLDMLRNPVPVEIEMI
ncbi:OsmC family protein [Salegentibacter chungangensis]|uniref:OsmC family protein n=1 Tax=Salegentibacter chungangensis TaxID=1335724 RepID=A0ABW3NSW8_9FLAO